MRTFLTPLLLLPLLLASCGTSNKSTGPTIEVVERGNFILYVSNQSFEIDPVDIRVSIDDQLVIEQDFYVENQHNWIAFQFRLEEGSHTIEADSESGGGVHLQREFVLADTVWAVTNFWYYPGGPWPTPAKLEITVLDYPPEFALRTQPDRPPYADGSQPRFPAHLCGLSRQQAFFCTTTAYRQPAAG